MFMLMLTFADMCGVLSAASPLRRSVFLWFFFCFFPDSRFQFSSTCFTFISSLPHWRWLGGGAALLTLLTHVCLTLQDAADGGTLARPHLHRRRLLQRRQDRLWQRPEVRIMAALPRIAPRPLCVRRGGFFRSAALFSPFCLEVIKTPKVLEYTLGCLLSS